jgi:AcrR family transcriptional regulator
VTPGIQQRRDARLERRRRRIADAALDLFATRGYNATSVEDVVERAKMSKSAFYEFFTSKEDCFRELLAHEGGSLIDNVLSQAALGRNHHTKGFGSASPPSCAHASNARRSRVC